MTTLDPSHNIFRDPSGRHAQAVHDPKASTSADADAAAAYGYPDELPIDVESENDSDVDDASPSGRARRRAKRQGRERIRRGMVPVPDLRFEQSYLLSIRPFLTPRPTQAALSTKGNVSSPSSTPSKSLVADADQDAVFHWGRQVDVDWRMVSWVTVRDQLLSPLLQGALWGWAGLFLAYSGAALRGALYPPSHLPRGRMTGGPGGKVTQAGGGEAVGQPEGWWRRFVKSWSGAAESATVLS